MLPPLERTIEVPCGQRQAFDVFLDLATWWPRDRFATSVMRGSSAKTILVEAREGGRILEVGADGIEHLWGRIRTYDPYGYLNLDFHVPHPSETDPGFSTVELRFTEVGPDRTRVELTQSNWEGLGDVADKVQSGYGKAWGTIFDGAYAEACAA